jgi:histidyl-tRNA synthetase
LDLHLARGLSYYTGPIFETTIPELPHMGSVTGGGRYDGLVGLYNPKRQLPATGATIGLDRLLAALEQLHPDAELLKTRTRVLVVVFFAETAAYSRRLAARLRREGINTESYLGQASLKKQFSYAHKKGIPWVVVAGDTEMAAQSYTLKHLPTGRQETLTYENLVKRLRDS